MNIQKKLNPLLVFLGLAAIAWLSVILLFADYEMVGFYFWGGLSFGTLAFVIGIASIFLIKKQRYNDVAEVSYLSVFLSVIYIVISVIFNSVFIHLEKGDSNRIFVAINLVILVIFIGARMYADSYSARVDEQVGVLQGKNMPVMDCSKKVDLLLAIAEDSSVRQNLMMLKQLVSYSGNTSQGMSGEYEMQFFAKCSEIQGMITEKREPEIINRAIVDANTIWKMRNTVR